MADIPLTIAEAGRALRARKISSVELTTALLARADAHDAAVGSYLARYDEAAVAAAGQADADLATGADHGPLHGIPLGVKDIIAAKEGATTAQSEVHDRSWYAGEDAVTVARLRAAGAVITGKLTTMEFAVGFPDPDKPFPTPRNPWDLSRWAGGSSSGTGNGVAAGFVLGGLGTDTGGSIRIPAALCGITGHKPTFGLVPKSGCVPLGYTLDHIGPMARSARDCALMLDTLAGFDASDPFAAPVPAPAASTELVGHARDLRVGVFRSFEAPGQAVDPDLPAVFERAVEVLVAAGASRRDVAVPLFAELTDAAFIGFLAEAFAYHRHDLRTRWTAYGRATRLALATGALYSGADYVQAQRVRRAGLARIAAVFRDVDVIVLPTALGPAPRLDMPRAVAAPFTSRPSILPTPAFDALGLPALSVPMGFTRAGLPLGLQIVGRPFEDAAVLRVGDAFQHHTDWHLLPAPLTSTPQPAAAANTDAGASPPFDERAAATVAAMLAAAGIQPAEAELAQLATAYPTMRATANALHAVTDAGDVAPVLGFRPF
jgi:aspartyl-tRNA(Asn)/glutamyl-tRNA(Gln) amidotransferase subunit A